jgi:hypothetical protein
MPVGVLDKLGNNYGGTSFNQSGTGDRVLDAQSLAATVLAIRQGNGEHFADVLTDADSLGNKHESTVNCRFLQITSHQDGTGLVSGGTAVPFPPLSSPIGYNFIQKAF